MNSFESLGVHAPIVKALKDRGITDAFKIQALVMEDALAGRDVLAMSKTGSGKTLAFAIPIAQTIDPKGPRPSALVLVPTRELCAQVVEESRAVAQAKGLRIAAAYGGVSINAQAQAAGKANILIATPGRLEDLCTRRMVDLSNVKILVLDEADRMLDMGFQPQVNQILRRIPKERQTMFFSATLEGEVGVLAKQYTKDPVRHEVVEVSKTVDLIDHKFIPLDPDSKTEALIDLLKEADGSVLVFVRTKRGVDRLVRKLDVKGVRAVAMHGDMSQNERERALKKFENGTVSTLIATDVAARGLDLDGITHVVNFDPPEDHTTFIHRVGRTARAGRSGTSITFVLPEQRHDVSRIASRLDLEQEFTKEGIKMSPPRVAYASHRGRRSMMGRPPKRRSRSA